MLPGLPKRFLKRLLVLLPALCTVLWLGGCAVATPAPTETISPSDTVVLEPVASPSPSPILPSQTPTLSATATSLSRQQTPTSSITLCSPLEDISLADMLKPDMLKNPFQQPRPGWDDGHFGADFAYWSRGEHKTMLGLPVMAAMSGRVAGIVPNREPYGNAVIIETPLDTIPKDWLQVAPTPAATVKPSASLYCPVDPTHYANRPGRSLYLLYAHLNQAPAVTIDQKVSCGQVIGEVGTTGRSVNPHLHLETRVGPAGATFPVMAHYDNAATDAEMATYCTWRVSGLFQAFDPVKLLALQP